MEHTFHVESFCLLTIAMRCQGIFWQIAESPVLDGLKAKLSMN
jgi:hypothetical protein